MLAMLLPIARVTHGATIPLLWIVGFALIIGGIVSIVRGSLLGGILLIIVGVLLGGLNIL
jgi:hypothetical protein